ncbi:MAG: cell division protein FtsL [Nitrospiria bacterium]
MSRTFLMFVLIVPMLVFAFLAVWQRDEIIRIGYRTETLQEKKRALLRVRKDLVAELSFLSTAERIEQIAREQLQMKPPDPSQRIYISMSHPDGRHEEE